MYDENATVTMRWNNGNKPYFERLGYTYTKTGDEFTVRVCDLGKSSNIKIQVTCDVCGKQFTRQYLKLQPTGPQGPHACSRKCGAVLGSATNLKRYGASRPLQVKQFMDKAQQTALDHYGTTMPLNSEQGRAKSRTTCLERYGVDHYSKTAEYQEKMKATSMQRYGVSYATQAEEVKEKIRQTNRDKYGVDYGLQLPEVQAKISNTCMTRYGKTRASASQEIQKKCKQTMIQRYGVDNPMKSPDIVQRAKNTCMERYGVENAMQTEEMQKKTTKTMRQRYGVDRALQSEKFRAKARATTKAHHGVEHPLQSPEIKAKQHQTLYADGVAPSSKAQRHICELVHGELNYPVDAYFVDIALVDRKIAIEYDGSGHDMCVTMGNMSRKQFEFKERLRENTLMANGWRVVRLVNKKDKLPDDATILAMIDKLIASNDRVPTLDMTKRKSL